MKLLTSYGNIIFHDDEWKINVQVDNNLVDFYRSLVPKYIRLNRTRFLPHITVVRKENIPDKKLWYKLSKTTLKDIEFQYSPYIYNDGSVYWWLAVHCPFLNLLRKDLGLEYWSELCRPQDNSNYFHITIGNTK